MFMVANSVCGQDQETTQSRKAIKAYREAKSALAVQNCNETKELVEKIKSKWKELT